METDDCVDSSARAINAKDMVSILPHKYYGVETNVTPDA